MKKGVSDPKAKSFRRSLMDWYQAERRPMPWKGEKDPYRIWISEIMLQQTRVETVIPYYRSFLDAYPDVRSLAEASTDDVLKRWEGLGYYTRARNLQAAAREVAYQRKGEMPDNYLGLLGLKGIGPYTAAAISSFAFGEARPVVDGNVTRVFSRYTGYRQDVGSKEGRKFIQEFATKAIDPNRPGTYNQAILDLGALVCKPSGPSCEVCPVQNECKAYRMELTAVLPRKAPGNQRRKRYFHFLLWPGNGSYYLEKRAGKDIWNSLYQFPMVEKEVPGPIEAADCAGLLGSDRPPENINLQFVDTVQQVLTHQEVKGYFYFLRTPGMKIDSERNGSLVMLENIRNFALPKMINLFLDQNFIHLKK